MNTPNSPDIPMRVGRLEGRNDGQDDVMREMRQELSHLRAALSEINSKLSSITYAASLASARVEGVSAQLALLADVIEKLHKEEAARKLTYKVGAGVMAVFATIGTGVLTLMSFWPQIKGFLRSLL